MILGTEVKGVPSGEIKKAISYGICKVNIATDARMIWTKWKSYTLKNSSCWVPQIKLEILSHDKQGQKVSITH